MGLALAAAVVACGDDDPPPVPVPLPSASPAGCARFAAELPSRLIELSRRATSPDDPRVAAYGDPPVVLRCGVPVPAAYEQGDPLVSVNGVAWYEQDDGDVVRWSTPRLFVVVEVAIPKSHEGHGSLLVPLADAVRAAQ